MKATFKLLGLALIIFLSSCSSDMLIVKRKYNKGFYVNTGGKAKQNDSPQIANKNDAAEEKEIAVIPVAPVATLEMPVTASVDSKPAVIAKSNSVKGRIITATVAKQQDNVVMTKSEQKQNAKIQKKAEKREARFAKKLSRSGGIDANTIVLIILAIIPFVSLIAMYLKDGKQITMNFWINLLLHFIALWWLFGILVVLDVIDLS